MDELKPTPRPRRTIAPKAHSRVSQAIQIRDIVSRRNHVPLELLRERMPAAAALAKAGFSSVEELYDSVARQFQLPRLTLDGIALSTELAGYVAQALARKHRMVPVAVTPHELSLAVCDPTQLPIFDWLGREHRRTITIAVATPLEIERAQARVYEAPRREPVVEINPEVAASRIVEALIAGAVEQRASDLHLEASEHESIVRYRVDGALRQVEARPLELHAAIVSRIKILANLDIALHHLPQDGRIRHGDIELRVSVLPTYWGEKVVCRVLDSRRAILPLDALGFDGTQQAAFLDMVRSPYGLVLVTGPTGSGKSTTLYAALSAVRDPEANVVTVEDPVEYQIGGINQVQVAPKRGFTFATALRSILRQDPDVILVGEIRDQETGILAAEAALTGHLVMSSLHTNDALGSIARLVELGVEPHLVAPSLIGVVAQRLVRLVCTSCRRLHAPTAEELAAVGLADVPANARVARATGCAACHGTGFTGRTAVRELLPITDALRALIARSAPLDELRAAAVAAGFTTMRSHAIALWLAGATTTRELIRVTRADR